MHETYLKIRALDDADGERWLEGWATRAVEDRMGDVVDPKGAQFELPLPLLAQHDHAAPVGTVVDAQVTAAGIRIRAKLARGIQRADELWQLIRDGAMSLSIGFRALQSTPLASGGLRFNRWEWHELSLVAVPACPGTRVSVGKSLCYRVAQPSIESLPVDRAWLAAAGPRRHGEDELAAHYRQFDAAVRLLPGELRHLADVRHTEVTGHVLKFYGPGGERLGAVDLECKRLVQPAPPKRKPQRRQPAVTPAVTAEAIGKAIGLAVAPLKERIAALEQRASESRGLNFRGYWRDGMTARKGDACTHDGSLWVAVRDTNEPPGHGSPDWGLAARKGADKR